MMFGKIIGQVCGAWAPVYFELFVFDTILDPIESHVHGFGSLLFDLFVCKAVGRGIIDLDWGGRLWVAHFM